MAKNDGPGESGEKSEKDDPRLPEPGPVKFSTIRAYMKNGGTFKVMFITMVKSDGYNHYYGVGGLNLCSIKLKEVVAFINCDIPEETMAGEKGPVKVFPAGVTLSTGYQFQ